MSSRRLGRWQHTLLDALQRSEAIRVQATIEASLGRRSTNTESTAARRAAHRLARAGHAKLTHVAFPAAAGRAAALSIVLTRPESRLIDDGDIDALRSAATAHEDPPPAPPGPHQTLRASIAAVEAAATATTSADLSDVSPAEAQRWAATLARSLSILNRLHHRLAHHSRRRR